MLQRSLLMRFRAARVRKIAEPLELFGQLQVGAVPPLAISRAFIQSHFADEVFRKRITEARIQSLDARNMAQLLRDLFMERYLAVPFRVFAFDLEFTGIPRFHADGPSEEVVELALYCPRRKRAFSGLVRPVACKMSVEAAQLTGISQEMLERDGRPFADVWTEAVAFMTENPLSSDGVELPNAASNLLLLSHGGKLADVSMIEWSLKKNNLRLPQGVKFGDTFQLIRDLHRKRPVTPDKYPPSWNLQDMANWLKLDAPTDSHRAAADARLTWDVVYHMMDRYGDHSLTPEQQFVGRFFERAAKERIASLDMPSIVPAADGSSSDGFADMF